VVVGGHGETVVGLLRPGFHSGTLPKLFAKLRRARRVGREGAALKRREALHHVEESVRRFVERDLAALLGGTRALGGARVHPGAIHLATNRVRVELLAGRDGHDAGSLWVELEERAGRLSAGVSRPGWLADLDADARRALGDALTGFFKRSGVERVHTPGRPDPSGTRFADVVVGWADWVAAWESERSGARPPGGPGWGPGVLPGREPAPARLPS